MPGAGPLFPAVMNQAFWKTYKSKVLQTLSGESEEELAEEVSATRVFRYNTSGQDREMGLSQMCN